MRSNRSLILPCRSRFSETGPGFLRPMTSCRPVAGSDDFPPTTLRACEHVGRIFVKNFIYFLPLKTASFTSSRRSGEVFSILSLFLPFPSQELNIVCNVVISPRQRNQ